MGEARTSVSPSAIRQLFPAGGRKLALMLLEAPVGPASARLDVFTEPQGVVLTGFMDPPPPLLHLRDMLLAARRQFVLMLFQALRHAPFSRLDILAEFGCVFRARPASLREDIGGRPEEHTGDGGNNKGAIDAPAARFICGFHLFLLFCYRGKIMPADLFSSHPFSGCRTIYS